MSNGTIEPYWTAVVPRLVRTATVGAACIAFVACGGQMRFTRAGATPQDFEADKYRCDQELGVNTAVGDPSTKIAYMLAGMYREQLERCLLARGWTRAQ